MLRTAVLQTHSLQPHAMVAGVLEARPLQDGARADQVAEALLQLRVQDPHLDRVRALLQLEIQSRMTSQYESDLVTTMYMYVQCIQKYNFQYMAHWIHTRGSLESFEHALHMTSFSQ